MSLMSLIKVCPSNQHIFTLWTKINNTWWLIHLFKYLWHTQSNSVFKHQYAVSLHICLLRLNTVTRPDTHEIHCLCLSKTRGCEQGDTGFLSTHLNPTPEDTHHNLCIKLLLGSSAESVLLEQMCCIQTKMFRPYRKMPTYHFSIQILEGSL